MILFLSALYIIIYVSTYKIKYLHTLNDTTFKLKITDYKIDGNQITFNFDSDIIGKYYFESQKDKINFNNNYSLGDTLYLKGALELTSNNTVPYTFNYKKYLKYKKINYILIENTKKIKSFM